METKDLLWKIIATLETIDVRGRGNLDKLLGCILRLEMIAKDYQEPPKSTPAENDHQDKGGEEA